MPLGRFACIRLADKVDRHVISHVPDLLRLELFLEVHHGRPGDSVHDLEVEDASRYSPALQDGKIEGRRVEVRLSGPHAVTDRAVAPDAEALVDPFPLCEATVRRGVRVWQGLPAVGHPGMEPLDVLVRPRRISGDRLRLPVPSGAPP